MKIFLGFSFSTIALGLALVGCGDGGTGSYSQSPAQKTYFDLMGKGISSYSAYWVSNFDCTDSDSQILSHLDNAVTLKIDSSGILTYTEKVSDNCTRVVSYELQSSSDTTFTALKKNFTASPTCEPDDAKDDFTNASIDIRAGGKILLFHGSQDCIAFGQNSYY